MQQYTTTSILDKLEQEREENALVTKELLDETNTWIELFETYPEVTFDLTGNPENFLAFLTDNKEAIDETVYKFFNGIDLEGQIEIEEEPPTTVSNSELLRIILRMQDVINGHTADIEKLNYEIENLAKAGNTVKTPILVEKTPYPPEAPTLPWTPPELPSSYPDYAANTSVGEDEDVDESSIEGTDIDADTFDNFSEVVKDEPAIAPKAKLTTQKKIMLVIIIIAAVVTLLTILSMPVKKLQKTEATQMQPPTSLNTPAALPTMNNVSSVKPPEPAAMSIQPQYEPVKPEPAKPEPKATTKATTKAETSKGYTENMHVNIKTDNNNVIIFAKDENVIDIEGQDTDNWIFNYKPEKHVVMFYAKANHLKNMIIIKTNKKTYTLNLVAANNGYTQINLAK